MVESLGQVYALHYPGKQMKTGRNVKKSPLHERLKERGACFREVSGWECADWFAEVIGSGVPSPEPYTWAKPHYFDRWAREHIACRESAVLIDMSFMSKFKVRGPDSEKFLNRLCTADVSEKEMITYCQWLNPKGLMEGDVTVAKISD